MSMDVWIVYVLTVLALMSTPGPSQLLMLTNSGVHGFQRSLATAAGDLTANALQMLAAGLGLAAIIVFVGRFLLVSTADKRAAMSGDEPLFERMVKPVAQYSKPIGLLVVIAAIALPFMPFANRYVVDVATLTLIYIMLGWGLNIVVGLAGLLVSLNLNLPRYFVEAQLGLELLGYFAALSYVLVAGLFVVNALGEASVSRLARLYRDGAGGAYLRLLLGIAGLGAACGLVGLALAWLAGAPLLRLLYAEDYAAYAGLFGMIMLAAPLRYAAGVLQFGLTAARHFRLQFALQAVLVVRWQNDCWLMMLACS